MQQTIVVTEEISKHRTKANSPYSSIKNRISMTRTKENGRNDASTSAIHARSNSSIALMRPAKNIDSGLANKCFTIEKAKYKKTAREDVLRNSLTCTVQNYNQRGSTYSASKPTGCYRPSNYQKAKAMLAEKREVVDAEKPVSPTKGSKAITIKMAELKVAASAEKPSYSFGQYKKSINTANPSLEHTPERKSYRTKANRASLQCTEFSNFGIIQSEQKEDMKKMLESHEVFNMRNSKRMDSTNKSSDSFVRPVSLQERRKQRKMWNKKK